MQFRAQEPVADLLELGRVSGRLEGVRRLAAVAHQARAGEQLVDVLGALLGAADQGDPVTHDVGDHAGEERVVGAAEDQGVDAVGDQRVEVAVGHVEQLVAAGHALLDEVDEPRTGLREELHVRRGSEGVVVGLGLGRGAGADHADPAGMAGGDGPPGGRIDHLDHRDVVPLAGVAKHRGARAVAGDDQGLDAFGDEVVEALEGVLADLPDRLGSVGLPGGVTDVEDRLVGQLVDHRTGHGESTEARVEDSDRSFRHGDKPRAWTGARCSDRPAPGPRVPGSRP